MQRTGARASCTTSNSSGRLSHERRHVLAIVRRRRPSGRVPQHARCAPLRPPRRRAARSPRRNRHPRGASAVPGRAVDVHGRVVGGRPNHERAHPSRDAAISKRPSTSSSGPRTPQAPSAPADLGHGVVVRRASRWRATTGPAPDARRRRGSARPACRSAIVARHLAGAARRGHPGLQDDERLSASIVTAGARPHRRAALSLAGPVGTGAAPTRRSSARKMPCLVIRHPEVGRERRQRRAAAAGRGPGRPASAGSRRRRQSSGGCRRRSAG